MVGPSGSGKSSILNLIPRFYDPDSGKLKIDGQNIKDLTISSVRSVIALVSQEPILFDMSIKENILYSRPNSTDEEIIGRYYNTLEPHVTRSYTLNFDEEKRSTKILDGYQFLEGRYDDDKKLSA